MINTFVHANLYIFKSMLYPQLVNLPTNLPTTYVLIYLPTYLSTYLPT
jgi:hypothetical protein